MTTATAQVKTPPRIRCAVYTRKSSEEGLEQDFNSLDAQRQSAESYIASMKHEGWICLPDRYDDGGFTGGNMERPALQRLLAEAEAGRLDVICVYKVDRLTRSLTDFAKMVEVFDRRKVAFCAVTQQINTANSMGRLMLNVLLSFAQFERELVSERTRDKIRMARQKGKWSGGRSVLGYDIDAVTKRLIVNPADAVVVRDIFALYLEHRSLLEVSKELTRRGLRTKAVITRKGSAYGGRVWDKHAVHQILQNILYTGRLRYKNETYAGEHAALIEESTWKATQEALRANGRDGGMLARNKYGALLKGLLRCAPCGVGMGHSMAHKGGGRVHRYYVCYTAQKQGWGACPCRSLPAEQIEGFVVDQIKRIGKDPVMLSTVLAKCKQSTQAERDQAELELGDAEHEVVGGRADGRRVVEAIGRMERADAAAVSKADVDAALGEFEGVWSRLSPKERAELVRLLVQRVEYDATKGTVSITFRALGLRARGEGSAPTQEIAA